MLTLEQLGFTQEELQQRVIDKLASDAMKSIGFDEDGQPFQQTSRFADSLSAMVKKQIDASISAIAERDVLPNVDAYIRNLTMTETNKWGEKTKSSLTFTEYLAQRAEAYLSEMVNYEGKPKGQDSYSWSGTQTRLTYLVHQHLHYSIDTAMKQAVKNANDVIVDGLEKTVKTKLNEIAAALQVSVKTK